MVEGKQQLIMLLFVVFVVSCKGGDKVSDGIAGRGRDCGTAATAFISLRKAAGDYDKKELEKRTLETEDDLRWCTAGQPRAGCCAAVKRLRDRIGRGKVAVCDDFFTALTDDGCTELQ